MSNPKEATTLEEIDMLRLKNLELREQLLAVERDALHRMLAGKYGSGDCALSVQPDGTIVRPLLPPELVSLPSGQ